MEVEGWVPLPTAVSLIRAHRKRVSIHLVLSALFGKAAAGFLEAVASTYEESAVPLENGPCRGIRMQSLADDFLYPDFFKCPALVENLTHENAWMSGKATSSRIIADHELPWRMRKDHETTGQMMRLEQTATGLRFQREALTALAASPDWSPWTNVLAKALKPGRIAQWRWDEVKAELTVSAARDPAVLSSTASIRERMQQIFEAMPGLGGEDTPDQRDIDIYASLIGRFWRNYREIEAAPM